MRILAGPDNWSFFTKYFQLGLESHQLQVFEQSQAPRLMEIAQTFEPDWVIWWLPEYQRLPWGVRDWPYRTLVVVSDWHLAGEALAEMTEAFDLVATDPAGARYLEGRDNVFQAPLYGFVPGFHRLLPEQERDVPVGYLGSINGHAYRERLQTLGRAALGLPPGQVQVFSGVYGQDYVRLLNRFQITLNPSLRGELNMRSFEAMACGSLLFCEDSNLEVSDHFRDGEHCVLFNQDNLVDRLRYYLDRPAERQQLARAGYERVQDYSYQAQGGRLLEEAERRYQPGRRSLRTEAERERVFCAYRYQVFNLEQPREAAERVGKACTKFGDNEELRNLRGCLEARLAETSALSDISQLAAQAVERLQRVETLGILPRLSLAQASILAGQPGQAEEVLVSLEQEPLQPVSFYPRFLHPLTFLFEADRDPEARRRAVMWLVEDLLSGLRFASSAEHCRRALKWRSDQPTTWFRLSQSPEVDLPERLAALRKTVELAPFFLKGHFELIRMVAEHQPKAELREALQATFAIVEAFQRGVGPVEEFHQLVNSLGQPAAPAPRTAAEFAQAIRFLVVSPEEVPESLFFHEPRAQFELLNTRFPVDDTELKKRLGPLLGMPRLSTLAIAGFLNQAVRSMPDHLAFLNVGVWHGYSFLSGLIENDKRCWGVDNFSEFHGPREAFLERFERVRRADHAFFESDYEDYFQDHQHPLGLYFYDGEHSYAHQKKGLAVAEPFFEPGCLVVVDDTNWEEPRQATLDFVEESSHRYRTVLDVTTPLADHPTWWNGMMILEFLG